MSDQSVRVARILGWEPRWPHRSPKGGSDGDVLSMQCAECGEWFNPIDRTSYCTVPWNPHWERDGRTRAGTPYDESDLANYLADCGLWVAIGNAYDGEGGMNEWDVTVSSVHGDGHNEPAVDHVEAATAGPTLLAALEAAVLAVAGDETPNPEGDDMSEWTQCSECLDGSVWQVNDSGRRFVVVNSDREYVWVDSLDPPTRRRRIRRAALRPSKSKTGYTLISGSPFTPEARS